MNPYFEKRKGIFRLFSLVAVAASVFVEEDLWKLALIVLGIGGLIAVSWFEGKKSTFYIYLFLLVLAVAVFLYFRRGVLF